MSKATVDALFDLITGETKMTSSSARTAAGRENEAHPRFSQDTIDEVYDAVLSGDVKSRTPKGQFSKGNSGNPRGRPKQALSPVAPPSELEPESLSAIALRHAATKVKAQTADGEVEMTLKEATVARMAREAVKGNTGHARTFSQLIGRAELEEIKLKREAFRHWKELKEQAEELHAQAKRAGDPPPLSVHPDDIELYTDGSVAIVGPTDPRAIEVMHEIQSRVDYHLVHIAYHEWLKRRCIRIYGPVVEGPLYAELEFWSEQNDLPPRLKMTVDAVVARLQIYARMSGRALHTLLRRVAEPHGLYAPPRDVRVPLIMPTETVESVKASDVPMKQFLPIWRAAHADWWNEQVKDVSKSRP